MTEKHMTKITLKAIDKITLLFCIWMLCLIAIGRNHVLLPSVHFIIFLTIIAGVLFLVWLTDFMKNASKPENCPSPFCRKVRPKVYAVLTFIRHYYPIPLYAFFFEASCATSRVFFHSWLDPFFMNIDKSIFGYLPSIEWAFRYKAFWLNEWLHFSYFSYYLMIVVLPVIFYLKKRKAMDELVFVVSLVFYFCYFVYSWLPVVGARYIPEAMQWTTQKSRGFFTNFMAVIYTYTPHLGGAFPSSHVAIAVVLTFITLKYFQPLGIICAVLTFFLAIATVYCHYHWFVDAVFGILTGGVGYLAAEKIFNKLTVQENEG